MNWMEALYQTYEKQTRRIGKRETKKIFRQKKGKDVSGEEDEAPLQAVAPLLPLYHSSQKAHVTVVLNAHGELRGARLNGRDDMETLIPVTEASSGRTSGVCAHPLCDKLQYVAGDAPLYLNADPGKEKKQTEDWKKSFLQYLEGMEEWRCFAPEQRMLQSIEAYVKKGTLIQDLVERGILLLDEETGRLMTAWKGEKENKPPIFDAVSPGTQDGVFIRWKVGGIMEEVQEEVWLNQALQQCWAEYVESCDAPRGLCYVLGEESKLASSHPARLRHTGDKAKLISSNDVNGYTFRGRMLEASEVCGVSTEVTQKAHSALRWLLSRQGWHDGDLHLLVWSLNLLKVPNPCEEMDESGEDDFEESDDAQIVLARKFREAIHKADAHDLMGEIQRLERENERVFVLGLNSASPGRMALVYFKDYRLSDYLANLMAWHMACRWYQYATKDYQYIGAPSIRMIIQTAYGLQVDDKLRQAATSRLLPCLLERQPIPLDIERMCAVRATRRAQMEYWERERSLGVACAIYLYNHNQSRQQPYTMSLDTSITTRSYLFGRLLAVAECTERAAQRVTLSGDSSDSKKDYRPTNAEKLMQRFSLRPSSTWFLLDVNHLPPYRQILTKKDYRSQIHFDKLLGEIMDQFDPADMADDSPLDSSFLLGYHCQKRAIYKKKDAEVEGDATEAAE